MNYLKSLPQDGLKFQKLEEGTALFPKELLVGSVKEVQDRAYEAEKTVGITEDQYNKEMNDFFMTEFGVKR